MYSRGKAEYAPNNYCPHCYPDKTKMKTVCWCCGVCSKCEKRVIDEVEWE